MKPEELLELIEKIPEEIKMLSLDILNKENDLLSLQQTKELKVSEEKLLIAMALDENGKKLFTNEDSRNAELRKRLSSDENYKIIDEKIRSIQEEINRAKIEIRFLHDKLKVVRIQTDLLHETSKTS